MFILRITAMLDNTSVLYPVSPVISSGYASQERYARPGLNSLHLDGGMHRPSMIGAEVRFLSLAVTRSSLLRPC